MKRKFIWKKFLIYRLFRNLDAREREHVMEVLPKKHQQRLEQGK